MCCMNVLQFYQACMSMSQSIIAAWASLSIAIMLLLVLRHPTSASCVAWMCCRMSNSIKHVWACLDLSFHRHWLYTFLHCLRSIFSPSRPLQLWFEAACETSLARDKYPMQSTQKSVEGATALFVCPSYVTQNTEVRIDKKTWHVLTRSPLLSRNKISHVLTERAWVRGVGIDLTLQSCCCWCYVITTCASCVAWMCCRMSNSIKHVWACPDQSSRRGHRYLSQSCCC